MPRISHFYGITITMHWREGHHGRPHFHARYAEHKASFDLQGKIIVGYLPRRQLLLVQAWVELHTEELIADWQRVVNKESPIPIDPLR